MSTFKLGPSKLVTHVPTGSVFDPASSGSLPSDYQAFLKAGGTPDAADPPPPTYPVPDYKNAATPPDQVADGVSKLEDYLALAQPTNAQTLAALRLTIQGLLFVLRRVF
jgi:hypothetical protein